LTAAGKVLLPVGLVVVRRSVSVSSLPLTL
jgi:hypothetical protein